MFLTPEQVKRIDSLIERGYIKKQKHPTEDLYILNYTKQCQNEQVWTDETKMCRGLIVDSQHNIHALPFKKFFNFEEYIQNEWIVPESSFIAYKKLDGSLGILYRIRGEYHIATRGSFTSEQAIHATKLLREKYGHVTFPDNVTILFEIIYPENRVVVDYGDQDELYILGGFDMQTGTDLLVNGNYQGIPVAPRMKDVADFRELTKEDNKKDEGYVIVFATGERIKMKFKEYVRLHRLYTGLTKRKIWEAMKCGEDMEILKGSVEEEFADFVSRTEKEIRSAKSTIFKKALGKLKIARRRNSRKDQAMYIRKQEHAPLIFLMLDGKAQQVEKYLWDATYPAAEKAFRKDIDV